MSHTPQRPFPLRQAAMAAALLAVAASGWSQQVFRIVGPDGRVTFSDRPPAAGAGRIEPLAVIPPGGSTAQPGGALPLELRQVVSRYPVTLYTTNNCAPCETGRNLLRSRGIPFSERTVNSPQDTEALKRISGEVSLPLLTVGSQQLKGYLEIEWSQYLDVAGYPKTSQLPRSYQWPAPSPLVVVPVAAAPAAAPASAPEPEAAAPAPAPSNPAGIRF